MEEADVVVNGRLRRLSGAADMSLLLFLRERVGLVGPKLGCGEGVCGVCTVLLDGEPVRACVVPASTAAGRSVTTVEGLASGDRLHPVQQAFFAEGAFQCGYCTPGMIMAVVALLERDPDPSTVAIVSPR